MDYGLSGESVRTRQLLRCDDVSTDSRVNHEVCRRLGIASVVVMPIVSDDQTLGVFELLSGKPRAFEERDLSALRRLSELVEHAVKHAILAHYAPAPAETIAPEATTESEPPRTLTAGVAAVQQASASEEITSSDSLPTSVAPNATPPAPVTLTPVVSEPVVPAPLVPAAFVPIIPTPRVPATKSAELIPTEKTDPVAAKLAPETPVPETPAASPAKPRFWSVATHPDSSASKSSTESARVPHGMRNLQKCQACGFPVSQGRTYCVECEEKQWRGQPLSKPTASATALASAKTKPDFASNKIAASSATAAKSVESSKSETVPIQVSELSDVSATPPSPPLAAKDAAPRPSSHALQESAPDIPLPDNSALFQTSAPAESWLAANKYVLLALLAVAIVISAIALLH
jgi:hypothetical protein